MIVEVETVARLCSRNGVALDSLPLQLAMRYTAADPYTAQLVFGDGGPTWEFDRDLLADGLASSDPVGAMDVQCWRAVSPGLVWLRLSNRDRCAVFTLARADVARFVRRSYALVERGRESEHLDLDAAIQRLLEPQS